jgi:hypothetical protein
MGEGMAMTRGEKNKERHNGETTMKPTHYFITNTGKKVNGIILSRCSWASNLYNFLCLCDDQETWMRDTVVIPSPILIRDYH